MTDSHLENQQDTQHDTQQENRQKNHRDHAATEIKYPLTILALDLHSPENLGSLLRIADALGVEKIILAGDSVSPTNPKVAKTARATQKVVSVESATNAAVALNQLRRDGYKIICLELTEQSISLADFVVAPKDKVVVVLGAERQGIAQNILELADVCVEIPMLGINSSMNVAAACAIAVYDITQKMNENNSLEK